MTIDQRVEHHLLTRLLWWQYELNLLTIEAIETLLTSIQEAQAEIMVKIQADIEGIAKLSEWRKEYDEQVMVWMDGITASTRANVTSLITDASIGVALASIDNLNDTLSFGGKAKAASIIEGLTSEQIQEFFIHQPLGGRLLAEWVDRSFSHGAQEMMLNAIRVGVLQGESIQKLEQRVINAAAQGFGITQREVSTLVRTYVQAANVGAQEHVYKQNEDIIKAYKRTETLDNHTCIICALADGAVYKRNEQRPQLPAHANCRGIYLPILVPFRELGLDMDDFEDIERNWAMRDTGPLGTHAAKLLYFGKYKGDYHGWWQELTPEEKAKTSIGPVRQKLLESGAVKWEDMWDRASGLPLTLEQMGFTLSGEKM